MYTPVFRRLTVGSEQSRQAKVVSCKQTIITHKEETRMNKQITYKNILTIRNEGHELQLHDGPGWQVHHPAEGSHEFNIR